MLRAVARGTQDLGVCSVVEPDAPSLNRFLAFILKNRLLGSRDRESTSSLQQAPYDDIIESGTTFRVKIASNHCKIDLPTYEIQDG